MSNSDFNDLLKPSLDKDHTLQPAYPSTAHVLVGWFGGPVGSVCLCLLSMQRMGVLKANLGLCLVISILSLACFLFFCTVGTQIITLNSYILFDDPNSFMRFGNRLLGVVIYGVFFLCFYQYFKASLYRADDEPAPWKIGLICAFIGFGFTKLATIILPTLV